MSDRVGVIIFVIVLILLFIPLTWTAVTAIGVLSAFGAACAIADRGRP